MRELCYQSEIVMMMMCERDKTNREMICTCRYWYISFPGSSTPQNRFGGVTGNGMTRYVPDLPVKTSLRYSIGRLTACVLLATIGSFDEYVEAVPQISLVVCLGDLGSKAMWLS